MFEEIRGGMKIFVFYRMSSDFHGNYQMKNEAEVKIKERAIFQTRNRLGLPDVTPTSSEKFLKQQ